MRRALALVALAGASTLSACDAHGERGAGTASAPPTNPSEETMAKDGSPAEKVTKSDAEWRRLLTPEQYHVVREKGTEAPFTGAYWDVKTPGTYRCVACGAVLFRSDKKFDAGCGWPSFYEAAKGAGIVETRDTGLGMVRTEVTCARCGAHLGHLFDDGPQPTGLRYCINSASLRLEEDRKGRVEDDGKKAPEPKGPAK